jgi:hypothetical protein
VGLADFLTDGNNYSLVADHCAKPKGESDCVFHPDRNIVCESVNILTEADFGLLESEVIELSSFIQFLDSRRNKVEIGP